MSDDLIRRLRVTGRLKGPTVGQEANEAADLIDALKAENERLRLMAKPLYSRRKLEAERDDLRAENERLRKEAAEAYEKGWADAMECAADDIRAEAERHY
jgi:hypothetical protein